MATLEDIISGCINGDSKSQYELYNIYSPRYYALCIRYLNDPVVAEDVLINGFVSIFQHIESYQGKGSFYNWMKRVFVNLCLNEIRNQKSRAIPAKPHQVASQDSDLDMTIDVKQALNDSLSHLNETERTIFNLIVVDEYKINEVAELINLPEGTVKSSYYRARAIIKEQMQLRLGEDYNEN